MPADTTFKAVIAARKSQRSKKSFKFWPPDFFFFQKTIFAMIIVYMCTLKS